MDAFSFSTEWGFLNGWNLPRSNKVRGRSNKVRGRSNKIVNGRIKCGAGRIKS